MKGGGFFPCMFSMYVELRPYTKHYPLAKFIKNAVLCDAISVTAAGTLKPNPSDTAALNHRAGEAHSQHAARKKPIFFFFFV